MRNSKELFDTISAQYSAYSDLVKSGHGQLCADHVYSTFPQHVIEEFSSIQLMVAKPDTIASGRLPELIDRLRREGLRPIHISLLPAVHEAQMEELYRYNIDLQNTKSMIGQWWIIKKPFALGPAALILLTQASECPDPVFLQVKDLKGSSIPLLGKPGELRYDFNGRSKSLNVLHCSDDPVSALREAQIFLDRERIVEIVDSWQFAKRNSRVEAHDVMVDHQLERAIAAAPPTNLNGDFATALNRLRASLLLNIDVRHYNDFCRRMALHVDVSELPANGPDKRLIKLEQQWTDRQADLLDLIEALQTSTQRHIVSLIYRLSNLHEIQAADANEAFDLLQRRGGAVGTWDQHMLESNLYYRAEMNAVLNVAKYGSVSETHVLKEFDRRITKGSVVDDRRVAEAPLLVGIAGQICVGKDFSAEEIKAQLEHRGVSAEVITTSATLREILSLLQIAPNRTSLQNLSTALWREFGPACISKAIGGLLEKSTAQVVLWTGVRTLDDVGLLREHERNVLIGISAEDDTRYRRHCQRAEAKGETIISLEEFTGQGGHATEAKIDQLLYLADLRLDNDGPIEPLASKVVRLLLDRMADVTPTHASQVHEIAAAE